ncbi:MAG: hypothetical protein A2722_01045 [Candidatus Doudnabacteria bacterium RIFCSPHIGHO2_01_FULL_50_11]|uniref:Uncharacterized protein n=1 Tax=Candidatus Doudnabacteria bacterium RIFCSPHIGHO2_01_FULL_50_11 TaxID=1817828 RepID=A0A1F5PEW8_9BACT|nr:MAG: hypothetical protein A2722_01045 [Candidatus Doudnabacteria bacterium RIFCSPHIGHO2_01_FULL_50_11]
MRLEVEGGPQYKLFPEPGPLESGTKKTSEKIESKPKTLEPESKTNAPYELAPTPCQYCGDSGLCNFCERGKKETAEFIRRTRERMRK